MKYVTAQNLELAASREGQNWITGTSNVRDVLVGTARDDILFGTGGDDLYGGSGDDTYWLWDTKSRIFERAGEGIDTVHSYIWGAITLADNVENLVLKGDGSSWAAGNGLNNIIIAGKVGATLNGMGGDDVLVGGAEGDLFRVIAGNGSDAIIGFQSGKDAISLQGYGITSFAQLMSGASQEGSDVRFKMANGETLVLRDIQLNGLTAYDFGMRPALVAEGGETLMRGAGSAWTSNGWYILNNVWNPGKLVQNVDYSVESTYHRSNMTSDTTFSWSFPFTTDPYPPVRAYPELIFGPSPYGGGGKATDVGGVFPLQVDDIKSLTATYDVSIEGNTSGFNVAFDIWLTKVPNGDGSTITNEIMVWLHKGDFEAFGPEVGRFSDGNFSATIYHTGTYTAVVADSDVLTGQVDVVAILARLMELGIVSPEEYLASVEFGAEVTSGTGSMTIHNFDLNTRATDEDGVTTTYVTTGAGTTRSITASEAGGLLQGGAGDDVLIGGRNADAFHGGGGNDTASYVKAKSGLTADLQTPSANRGEAAADRYTSIENLTGSAFNDILRGDAGANRLFGGDGADVLQGRDGDDLLIGGAGADRLDGGNGIDTVSYGTAAKGLEVDLQSPQRNTGDAAGDTFISVENVTGSGFNDTIRGNAANNAIRGGGGGDVLMGRDGNDIIWGEDGADSLDGGNGADKLYGGDGNDNLTGGAGADLLDGGTGTDRVSHDSATRGVTVDLQSSTLNTGDAAGDSYVSIEDVSGSAYNDILRGDTGANTLYGRNGSDRLEGRDGQDILDGGAGADVLDGGSGFDVASYTSAAQGVTANLANPSSNKGDALGDVYRSVEALYGSKSVDILTGDAGANYLYGDLGNDTLDGGSGNDTLYGGWGVDKLRGGDGADRFLFAEKDGDSILDFTPKVDFISLSRSVFDFTSIIGAERVLTSADADFLAAGTAATSGKATFFWNASNGALTFDADGNGAGREMIVAWLKAGTKLSLSDIYTIADSDMTIDYLLSTAQPGGATAAGAGSTFSASAVSVTAVSDTSGSQAGKRLDTSFDDQSDDATLLFDHLAFDELFVGSAALAQGGGVHSGDRTMSHYRMASDQSDLTDAAELVLDVWDGFVGSATQGPDLVTYSQLAGMTQLSDLTPLVLDFEARIFDGAAFGHPEQAFGLADPLMLSLEEVPGWGVSQPMWHQVA